jgi:hypothetical protein
MKLTDFYAAANELFFAPTVSDGVDRRVRHNFRHRHVATRRARSIDKRYGFSCGRDDLTPRAHRRGAEHAV